MLKGIPRILTPELFKVMMEMGHGDELVLADGNYPRFGSPSHAIRMDGHGIPEILDAILQFMPLDSYDEHPVVLMNILPCDTFIPAIWEKYRGIVAKYEPMGAREVIINKHEFYERAAKAYAVVATGEQELYANIILKKGVI